MDTYKIVRIFRDMHKENIVIETGMSLEDAQAHCQDPDTCKEGVWFDSYTAE